LTCHALPTDLAQDHDISFERLCARVEEEWAFCRATEYELKHKDTTMSEVCGCSLHGVLERQSVGFLPAQSRLQSDA